MNWLERNDRNKARIQGQAGVFRVASELLLRGLNPQFPSVDCGADLIVEGGVQIQVKSAHLRYQATCYPQGAYWFKLTRGPVAHGNHGLRKRSPRVFSEDCEFVVFWGIEQHRFWVVPAPLVDGRSLLVAGPDIGWKDVDVDQIKRLHSQGLTDTQIAEQLGVSRTTVKRRLLGKFVEPVESRALTHKVRECEGRWDSIESSVRLATGVNTAEILQEK